MTSEDRPRTARRAALARLEEIAAEEAAILAVFPDLRLPAGSRRGRLRLASLAARRRWMMVKRRVAVPTAR
jgi:hypothetical protein